MFSRVFLRFSDVLKGFPKVFRHLHPPVHHPKVPGGSFNIGPWGPQTKQPNF